MRLRCPSCNGEGFATLGDRHARTKMDVCRYPGCYDGWIEARTGETPQSSASPTGAGTYASDEPGAVDGGGATRVVVQGGDQP